MESEEEYDFQDSLGGVFSTEMFETNLRIEGEMRGTKCWIENMFSMLVTYD